MFKPLEIVGDTAFRTTDQKVRGSNPFERARQFNPLMRVISFCSPVILLWTKSARHLYKSIHFSNYSMEEKSLVEIQYTPHALARMTQRGISIANVETVLQDFHFSVVSIRSGMRIEGNVDGRILKLWIYRFPKNGDRVIIESAVWKGENND